ncbi:MAG TPA: IS66 family transposase [Caulobacteraceae bacterium]|jgi:transposase|nr:IS66 family transposase [Caulobacteraceae bacterium]
MSSDIPGTVEALVAQVAELQAELRVRELMIDKLRAQLAALRRARFGASSEKLDRQIEQLELILGDLEESRGARAERVVAAAPPRPEAKPAHRAPLPSHLPREIVRHEAPGACPACGGARFSPIGADEREVLEYVPAHFKVVVHVRPKLSCRDCETIRQAPMPSLPIERGLPGPALLAHVAVAKYADHLPLYRQSEIYQRSGVDLDRSTLADWVGRMSMLLEPLAQEIGAHVRSGATLHADDTPVPVLDPGRGKTKTGRLWTVVRDERPWAGPAPPAALYLYSSDRKGEHAETLLSRCRGFLHADGYAGWGTLYTLQPASGVPRLAEVACWAHARRKIFEVHEHTASAAAKEALERMAELFAIEAEINGRPPDVRLAVRRERSAPKLHELRDFLDKTLGQISRKSTLAGAIRYTTSRWEALARFTTDGRLEMTNNAAERAIRPLALGRKNYLFAGSDAGGRRAAVLYTLITTARLNGLDPEAWLADVVGRIADHPMSRIGELLPWNWRDADDRRQAA